MSVYFSYNRLLEAVSENKLTEVRKALHFLHDKIYNVPLVDGLDAVQLAMKLDHHNVVKLLLTDVRHSTIHEMLHNEVIVKGFIHSACEYGFYDEFELLTKEEKYSRWTRLDTEFMINTVPRIARTDNMKPANWIFKYLNQSIRFSQKHDTTLVKRFMMLLIDNAYRHGNSLSDLGEEITESLFYKQLLKEYHPVHQAVFTNDMDGLIRLMKVYEIWFNISYHPKGVRMTPIQLAAFTGNVEMFLYMKIQAEKIENPPELAGILEECLDSACQRGRQEIFDILINDQSVKKTYSKRWFIRLILAVKNNRTNITLQILNTYFTTRTTDGPTKTCLIGWTISPDLDAKSPLGWAITNYNLTIVKKCLECLQILGNTEREFLKLFSQSYELSQEKNRPTCMKYFYKFLSKKQITNLTLQYNEKVNCNEKYAENEVAGFCMKLYIASLKSMPMAELLFETNKSRFDGRKILYDLPTLFPKWHFILAFILRMDPYLYATTDSKERFKLYNRCREVMKVTRSHYSESITPELMEVINPSILEMSSQFYLRPSPDSYLISKMIAISAGGYIRWERQTTSLVLIRTQLITYYNVQFINDVGIVANKANSSNAVVSLKSCSRKAVHRQLAKVRPEFSNYSDRILSLGVDGYLPEELAGYLLFRKHSARTSF